MVNFANLEIQLKLSYENEQKKIPHGTFQAIILQSGLKESEFHKNHPPQLDQQTLA